MMAVRQSLPRPDLRQLLDGWLSLPDLPALEPTDITMDSRRVMPGGLFLACAGASHHGMVFAAQAREQGAAAVIAEPTSDWNEDRLLLAADQLGLPVIALPRLSACAGEIAARFYSHPSESMAVIGITGTNGKTSVSHFLAAALADGHLCGVLGTLGYGLPGALHSATHTTPDAVRVHGELATLCEQGADSVAMEVSSHALHQHRVAGVQFHTAVFTNLTRDHLDYHGDMASYGEVKAGLFEHDGLQLAVINSDDAFGRDLAARCRQRGVRVIACGIELAAPSDCEQVRASDIVSHGDGLAFNLQVGGQTVPVGCGLLGRFNVDNLLLVAGVLHGWGLAPSDIARRLAGLRTVPGRMERFGGRGQPTVVVDYAHTPDALTQVLTALRAHVTGRLYCVFGCGGDRDTGKRPLMGQVAERLADRVVVTDDNPRSEDGDAIVAQILAGMSAPHAVRVERNRAQAIAQTIKEAASDDLVLIAGKGHEDYQQVGELRVPFSDVAQVNKALAQDIGGAA
jgi:UDP-N-acetylmuramoyl-L-alanyl-D-glutamate--2,6-diaminopimelate ligase